MHISGNKLLLTLTGALLLTFCGCKDQPAEEAAMPVNLPIVKVSVLHVAAEATRSQNEATGTVESVQRATIAAKVSGIIEQLPVELGSVVKKGDLLVGISAGEINARVAQAEAQLAQTRRNLDREKRLLDQGASTPETVKSLEDALRVAEAGYNEARAMQDYTTITAPFGGVITGKNVQAGDLATPGTPLLVLENNRKLQVVASVPEALALGVKTGQQLVVRIAAAGIEQSGEVSEISPAADPRSRTTTIKLQIRDASNLRPGQYVRVLLPGAKVESIMVPTAAISNYGQMERIFVVENGTARLRLVRTGPSHGDQVEILSGLEAGEQVVVRGQDLLTDGQPVEIVP